MRNIDLIAAEETLIAGIKNYVGSKTAIIGISGGVDSALVAALCVAALGKEKVLGLLMPYSKQKDISDSKTLVSWLGINYETINIKPKVDVFGPFETDLVKANVMARVRMIELYKKANTPSVNGLVIGTTNASEWAIGYFTKFGDGACDFEPIIGLCKTEVWKLSKILGIPECIINKKPSAGLRAGQTDESDFGFTYKELDAFLQCEKVNHSVEIRIKQMINNSTHKKQMPPGIKIS